MASLEQRLNDIFTQADETADSLTLDDASVEQVTMVQVVTKYTAVKQALIEIARDIDKIRAAVDA